jgi:hypothetical protein
LRGLRQFRFVYAGQRNERRRLSIAECDRAGLIKQQCIHITRSFNRPA